MNRRTAIVLAVPFAAVLMYTTGAYRYATPTALRELLLGLGPLGPVAFIAAFAVGATVWLPSMVFILCAALTWPPLSAVPIIWIGGVVAGLPAFLLARYAARDWVQSHLGARLHRIDRAVKRGGVRGVILLRLLMFLHPAVPPALALSQVRFSQFVLGSVVGLIPGALIWGILGARAVEWARGQPPVVWVAIGLGIVGVLLVIRIVRRRALVQAPGAAIPAPDAAEA